MQAGRNLVPSGRGAWSALLVSALAAAAMSLVFVGPASARHFPSPRCGWVKPSLIDRTFGLHVKAKKPHWTVKIAPILHCNYVERQSNLQVAGKPIVRIEFREVQRVKLAPGFLPVKGLGSCRVRVSCPAGHRQAAWIYTGYSATSASLTPFTSGVALSVEDGLNMLSIEVLNPFGPLPVQSERAAAIHLAKKLLPRFRYK